MSEPQQFCILLPLSERLRHLISVFGKQWIVVEVLNDRVRISSMDGAHIRWADIHNVQFLPNGVS